MRYSTEPKFRKYVKGFGFLSFARKFGDKCGKNFMYTGTKTEINAAKTTSKRVVQKTAEATGVLIGNKMADKITSLGKPKEKKKKFIFRQKKDNTLLMALNCFEYIKMEFQKIANLLGTTSDDKDLPRFVTKNWVEVYDLSKKMTMSTKKLELKHPC